MNRIDDLAFARSLEDAVRKAAFSPVGEKQKRLAKLRRDRTADLKREVECCA
jgi:hypothetical protein